MKSLYNELYNNISSIFHNLADEILVETFSVIVSHLLKEHEKTFSNVFPI